MLGSAFSGDANMKHSLLCLSLLACAALGAQASAQAASSSPTIKPGLWQVDSKMASPDAATDNAMSMVLQQLGNLPPDQRKQLESMAASRGMAMPTVGARRRRARDGLRDAGNGRAQADSHGPARRLHLEEQRHRGRHAGVIHVRESEIERRRQGAIQRRPGVQHAAGGDDQRARHAGTGECDEQRQVAGSNVPCAIKRCWSETVTEAHIEGRVAAARVAGIAHRVAGAILVVDLRVGRIEIAAF